MVTSSPNISELRSKLIEKLKPSGWSAKLKTFLDSSDFDKILSELARIRYEDQKRFTPPLKNVFRAFEECPYSDLKVIMIGQDPYPELGVADGIAFSCSNTGREQPSLRYMLDAVAKTVYPGTEYKRDPDLSRWSKQGVLMLNSALTTEIGKPGTHVKIWEPFIAFVVDMLNSTHKGLSWVFLGEQAREFHDLVDGYHYKFKVTHPASASYLQLKQWPCLDVFNGVNNALEEQNQTRIVW